MLLFYFYISCAFLYTRHQQVAKVRHTPNDPGKVMQVLSVTRGKDPKDAGSAVDDRMMLTAAGRECCRRSNDAHGRTPGVL